jgi:hypothetical protein
MLILAHMGASLGDGCQIVRQGESRVSRERWQGF